MKKLLLLLVTLTLGLMVGYSYDDSAILDKIAEMEKEHDEMEKEHDEMQAQIDAQQTLLDALANKLTITNIVQNTNGYTISFSDGTTATINNGKDGDKGEDGEDGDSFFAEVVVGTTDVTFTPADGTVVVIPLGSGSGSGNTSAEGNKIYYTTSDGKKLLPYNTKPAAFGAILVSNTYEEGQGVLTFDDTITSIGRGAFYDCSSLTSITIPDSVTSIGYCAFDGCKGLTSVTIPDSVTEIGDYAFAYCSSLTSISIPDSVTEIGDSAFYFCYSLTSISIPDSVTSIGDDAFCYCASLTSVTIPDGVTEIGETAFNCCYSLTSVYCKPTTPPSGDSRMFYNNASGRKIYVPAASVEAYKSANYWSDYAADIVGYDF